MQSDEEAPVLGGNDAMEGGSVVGEARSSRGCEAVFSVALRRGLGCCRLMWR